MVNIFNGCMIRLVDSSYSSDAVTPTKMFSDSLFLFCTGKYEVLAIFKNLKKVRSADPDELQKAPINHLLQYMSSCFTHIFNLAFLKETFLKNMQKATHNGLNMNVGKIKAVAFRSKNYRSFPTEHLCFRGPSIEIAKPAKLFRVTLKNFCYGMNTPTIYTPKYPTSSAFSVSALILCQFPPIVRYRIPYFPLILTTLS